MTVKIYDHVLCKYGERVPNHNNENLFYLLMDSINTCCEEE